jgi:hypothetical protein
MAGESYTTTHHGTIREWAEERNGVPALIEGTEGAGAGVLRIHFPDYSQTDAEFEEIAWETFFDQFEENDLAMVYQEETRDGELSRFNKFVSRNG